MCVKSGLMHYQNYTIYYYLHPFTSYTVNAVSQPSLFSFFTNTPADNANTNHRHACPSILIPVTIIYCHVTWKTCASMVIFTFYSILFYFLL